MGDVADEVERNVREWLARARSSPEKPVALEVLWDGDTQGWYVSVSLVFRHSKSRWSSFDQPQPPWYTEWIASLRYGGDIRLFQGKVPPWPEAVVAERAGRRVAEELGIEFYFPAPAEPDDACPSWCDRGRAVSCRTCGKLLASDRPSAWAGQCHPCEMEQEHRRKIVADEPGSPDSATVSFVREVGGHPGPCAMFSLRADREHGVLEPVRSLLRMREPPEQLSAKVETTLTLAEREVVSRWCAQRIDRQLEAYAPRTDLPAYANLQRVITWRGIERTIQVQFNEVGADILSLVPCHSLFDPGAAGTVHLLGNGGITARDLSILAKARAGARTVGEIQDAFPFLDRDALERTLSKLVARQFIVREGDSVRLLLKGRAVDWAGPAE